MMHPDEVEEMNMPTHAEWYADSMANEDGGPAFLEQEHQGYLRELAEELANRTPEEIAKDEEFSKVLRKERMDVLAQLEEWNNYGPPEIPF